MTAHFDPLAPGPDLLALLAEPHLATLTTLRPDGRPHVTPVGFTYEPGRAMARVITFAGARKVANVLVRPGAPAVLCQVDGGRWVALEGTATVSDDPDVNRDAERRYAARYRQPRARPDRVTIEVQVTKISGNVGRGV